MEERDRRNTLSSLRPGERTRIKALFSSGSIRRRLLDLGFVEGTEIECVLQSPAGDPCAYLVRGAVIAIRREDGEKIIVEERGEERHEAYR